MEKLSALIEGIQLSFKDEEFLTMAVDILNKGKEEPKDDMWLILQRQKNFHEACEFLDGIMKKMDSVELSENESEFVDIISDAILEKVKRLESENASLKKENKDLKLKIEEFKSK